MFSNTILYFRRFGWLIGIGSISTFSDVHTMGLCGGVERPPCILLQVVHGDVAVKEARHDHMWMLVRINIHKYFH
jgi:hypothetical protein